MKRFLFLFLLSVLSLTAKAADLASGETFADGQSVTGTRLNNAVNGATILPAFVSNKDATAPVLADSFLFYQAGSGNLKRSTGTSLQALLLTAPTFTGVMTISEQMVVTGIISPDQITADQNNYNPTGLATATTLRLSSDAARTVTGIAGGASGRILIIHNVGSFAITFATENASSTDVNRFSLTSNFVLQANAVCLLNYGGTVTRWRIIGERPNIAPAYATLTDGATITLTCDPTKAVQNSKVTLGGNRQLIFASCAGGMSGEIRVTQDGTGSRKLALPGPSYSNGVSTSSSTTFTSATDVGPTFVAADVGRIISEPGAAHIPAGTTISAVGSTSSVTLSAAATASGTGITFYLPGRTSKVVGGGAGATMLSSAAGSLDILTWSYDGTNLVWARGLNAN